MNLEAIKESIVKHVYHIPKTKVVPLHKHEKVDEIFYCIKGEGIGVLEDKEIKLSVGDVFLAPAGKLHSLKSESDLYVTAFLIPKVD